VVDQTVLGTGGGAIAPVRPPTIAAAATEPLAIAP
jgi:hypothetical protein